MGTPDFAVPCLKALVESGENVTAVFSQPDKPKGRHGVLTAPPVKELALKMGVPVFQPTKMRDGTALEMLKSVQPELVIVVAYGKILPKEILDYPKYGCINIHASLLPKPAVPNRKIFLLRSFCSSASVALSAFPLSVQKPI